MTTLAYTVPTPGTDLNAIADPEMATALTAIKAWANGSIDAVNLSALLAQSVGANQNAQVVKGAVSNAGPGTRTNVAYGALNDAADQVTGIVLPTNGLISVWYQALWQESVSGAASAALFLNSNQITVQGFDGGATHGPLAQAAWTGGPAANNNLPLFSWGGGLGSAASGSAYNADTTTGQLVGFVNSAGAVGTRIGAANLTFAFESASSTQQGFPGGPCYIFAAAGTYTLSVQFKASSGSVTASNRKLWVQAVSFA